MNNIFNKLLTLYTILFFCYLSLRPPVALGATQRPEETQGLTFYKSSQKVGSSREKIPVSTLVVAALKSSKVLSSAGLTFVSQVPESLTSISKKPFASNFRVFPKMSNGEEMPAYGKFIAGIFMTPIVLGFGPLALALKPFISAASSVGDLSWSPVGFFVKNTEGKVIALSCVLMTAGPNYIRVPSGKSYVGITACSTDNKFNQALYGSRLPRLGSSVKINPVTDGLHIANNHVYLPRGSRPPITYSPDQEIVRIYY